MNAVPFREMWWKEKTTNIFNRCERRATDAYSFALTYILRKRKWIQILFWIETHKPNKNSLFFAFSSLHPKIVSQLNVRKPSGYDLNNMRMHLAKWKWIHLVNSHLYEFISTYKMKLIMRGNNVAFNEFICMHEMFATVCSVLPPCRLCVGQDISLWFVHFSFHSQWNCAVCQLCYSHLIGHWRKISCRFVTVGIT